jgi:hypothetical protein
MVGNHRPRRGVGWVASEHDTFMKNCKAIAAKTNAEQISLRAIDALTEPLWELASDQVSLKAKEM